MAEFPFHPFPRLPTELRNHIWRQTIPSRVLQLGFDFPFPIMPPIDFNGNTRFPTKEDDSHGCHLTSPVIPAPLPSIFHISQESRAIALEEYIPFAYSYLHPSLDTLYIPCTATKFFGFSTWRSSNKAFFYPLACLDKIVLEYPAVGYPIAFDQTSVITGRMWGEILSLLHCVGIPKELWVVLGPLKSLEVQRMGMEKKEMHVHQYTGFKDLAFREIEECDTGLKERLQGSFHLKFGNSMGMRPWMHWRVPEIRFFEAVKGEVMVAPFATCGDAELRRVYGVARRVGRELEQEHWDVHGRKWDLDRDGHFCDRANVERGLARRELRCPWDSEC